jgi:hypothetical protein
MLGVGVHLLALAGTIACSGANSGADGASVGTGSDGDDGGDDGGTIGAVCGNAVVEAGEVCDGPDLGGQACATQPGFIGGTLACTLGCDGLDTSGCQADPAGPLVRLNEITASDVTRGTYAGAGDAIELYNVGAAAADLSEWELSDDAGFPADKTYVFPAGTTLLPGEFAVVVRLDDMTGEGDYPFGVSSSNPETIGLRDAAANVIDSVSFDGPDATISWCRLPDGDGDWGACALTLGASNTAGGPPGVCGDDAVDAGEACDGDDLDGADCPAVSATFVGGTLACADDCTFDTSACELDPKGAAVVVNELTSSSPDDIELYNAGARDVDIGGWILTDDITDPRAPYDPMVDAEALTFAAGTIVPAGGFLVVQAGAAPDGHPFGLGAGGDAVTLLDGALVVQDHVAYGADEAVTSYCRDPDGPRGAWQAACTPTFGAANQP